MDPRNRGLTVVAEIQALMDGEAVSRAVDHTYRTLDTHLLAGEFDQAEYILRAMQTSGLPLAVRLSALTITTPWRQRFRLAHEALRASIKAQAFAIGGQQKVDAVFRGIR